MNRVVRNVIILWLMTGCVAAVFAAEALAPMAAFSKDARILFQGDSITDGKRGRSEDPNHILGHGYCFIIAAKYGAGYPDRNLTFINRGVSGNTVRDLEKRWATDTVGLKPDLLSVLIGVNDAGSGVPLDEYEKTYDQLLTDARAANPKLKAELGLDDNTLFIFLSDNGPCAGSVTLQRFMAGLHGLKGTPFENGIRTPCFMRWPKGFECSGKISRLAAHIDIMPTILDACGAAKPEGVKWDGTSLMPLLRNPAADWPDRTLFFQWDGGPMPHRGMAYAARSQRYKLVQPVGAACPPNQKHIRDRYTELCVAQGKGPLTLEGEPRYLLYDVSADPGETKNIAAEHPEIVEKMKRQYEEWFDDVWPTKGSAP